MVESCVEKLRKPDKAIFDITLERLGVAASKAVFLDDIGGNLKTAKQMGMATIKVTKNTRKIIDEDMFISGGNLHTFLRS